MPLTIDTPEAAVAATPYLLGFVPRDSLVLLLLDGHGLSVSMRVDLPPAGDLGWLQCLLNGIPEPVPDGALLMVYSDTVPADHGQAVGMWVMQVLVPVLQIVDVVHVAQGRFASWERGQLTPEDGEALATCSEHPVIAACVAAGLTCAADRDALVAQVQYVDDAMSQRVAVELSRRQARTDYETRRDALERDALALLWGTGDLTAADVALVARACADVHVRDPLLARVLDCYGEGRPVPLNQVRTRLLFCLTHIPERHAAAVAATLALLAWSDGDGAVALVTAERALESDPSNTLAPLVTHALQYAMPPDTWATLTRDIPLEHLRGRRRHTA